MEHRQFIDPPPGRDTSHLHTRFIGQIKSRGHTQLQDIGHHTPPLSPEVDKIHYWALAEVAQWIEYWPANQRVAGSIPSQGACLGCGPGLQ